MFRQGEGAQVLNPFGSLLACVRFWLGEGITLMAGKASWRGEGFPVRYLAEDHPPLSTMGRRGPISVRDLTGGGGGGGGGPTIRPPPCLAQLKGSFWLGSATHHRLLAIVLVGVTRPLSREESYYYTMPA